ncbi:hypothetical protein N566_01605 [Streptomycetaceae bacterium MP113-05]|nr:hypothetical protein N566_01605 [Streptomycetaceae bacterium MP113-05]
MLSTRSLIRLAPVIAAVTALTACGADGSPPRAEEIPASSERASSTPKPPEELCVDLVAHWAERELSGDSGYGDYQSRGLSDGQNNILLEVVAEAKAEREKRGKAAAARLIEREARQRCAEFHKDGGPTSAPGGWPA